MKGRPPKSPELRHRKAAFRVVQAPARSGKRRVPVLPAYRKWDARTRDWWREVWLSEVADEYLPADKYPLLMLATLIDMYWGDPKPTLASEIRLQSAAFGLSPVDRRRLQIVIRRAEPERQRPRLVKKSKGDPRQLLQGDKPPPSA